MFCDNDVYHIQGLERADGASSNAVWVSKSAALLIAVASRLLGARITIHSTDNEN